MNPLAGVADTAAQVARLVRPVRLTPPRRPEANRAQRRAAGQRSDRAVTGAHLAAARRCGELARRQGVAHTAPGACPFTVPELIGAWSEGYTGKRLETSP